MSNSETGTVQDEPCRDYRLGSALEDKRWLDAFQLLLKSVSAAFGGSAVLGWWDKEQDSNGDGVITAMLPAMRIGLRGKLDLEFGYGCTINQ